MPIHPQAQAVIDGNGWGALDPATVGVDALRQAMNTRLIELAGIGPELESVADGIIDSGPAPFPSASTDLLQPTYRFRSSSIFIQAVIASTTSTRRMRSADG